MVRASFRRPSSPNRASAAAEARTAAPDNNVEESSAIGGPLDSSAPDSSIIDDSSFFTYGDGTVNDTDSDDDDEIDTEMTVCPDDDVDIEVPTTSSTSINTGGYIDIHAPKKKHHNLNTPVLLTQVDSFTGIRNQILHHSQVMREQEQQQERRQAESSSSDDDQDEDDPNNSSIADDNTFDYTFDEETAMSLTNDGGEVIIGADGVDVDADMDEDGNSSFVASEIMYGAEPNSYFTVASSGISSSQGGASYTNIDSYFSFQPPPPPAESAITSVANTNNTNTNTAASMLMTTADLAAEIMASSSASQPADAASHKKKKKKSARKSSSRTKSATAMRSPVEADQHPHGAQFVVDQLEADTSKDTSILSRSYYTKTYKPWMARHKRILLVLVLLCIVVAAAVGIVVALEKKNDDTTRTGAAAVPGAPTTTFPQPDDTDDNGEPSLFDDRDDSGNDDSSSNTTTTTTTPGGSASTATSMIVSVLQEQDDMSLFPDALMTMGIMDEDKKYTILAPTDTAMMTGGSSSSGSDGSVSTLAMLASNNNNNNLETTTTTWPVFMNKLMKDPAWSLHLRHLMLHHIVEDERLTMTDLANTSAAGGDGILTMASGEEVEIRQEAISSSSSADPIIVLDGSITVDATANDLQAADENDNVIAHVIDGLLQPEFLSRSVLDVTTGLQKDDDSMDDSMFSVLLIASGLGTELQERLNANYTLFAPTNEAFEAVDARTMFYLQSTQGRDLLIETMQQHIVPVVVPTTTTTQTITTIAGTTLHPAYDAMGHISSVNGAAIVTPNALALNGIVHTIDTVLLPESAVGVCDFQCPVNSEPKAGWKCHVDMDDCDCLEGYQKQGEECAFCSFECPLHSTNIVNDQECYSSMDDCQCDEGFSKQGDDCVFCSYVCPANSRPITEGLDCYSSFDACICDMGYLKRDEECKFCDFTCPTGSVRTAGLDCYSSFDDCDCADGFIKQGQECVAVQPDCNKVFQCPGNSQPIAGRLCYVDINDCQCNDGFVLEGDSCVAAPTGETPTICDYRCPAFSWRLRDRDCWSSFDDCRCAPTYIKENERCVYKGQAPHRGQTSGAWVDDDDYYPF